MKIGIFSGTIKYFLTTLYYYYKHIFFQKKILGKFEYNIPKEFEIKLYEYVNIPPIFLGYQYLKLVNKKLDFDTIKKMTLTFAVGSLEDKMVEDRSYSTNQLNELLYNYQTFTPKNNIEKLYKGIAIELMGCFNDADKIKFFKYLEKLHKAQIESKRQTNSDLGYQELKNITFNKNAYCCLLTMATIVLDISMDEESALKDLGFWFGLLDDFVDLEKDKKDGIVTIANTINDPDFYRKMLDEQRKKVFDGIKKLPYSEKNKKNFLFSMYYASVGQYLNVKDFGKMSPYECLRFLVKYGFKEISKFEY